MFTSPKVPDNAPAVSALPSETSRQKGLQIIDFLKNSATAESDVKVEESVAKDEEPEPPVDANPFDDTESSASPPTVPDDSGQSKVFSSVVKEHTTDSRAYLSQGMVTEIKDMVSMECKIAVEEVLRRDLWREEICSQIANGLKSELTSAIGDAVQEAIKENLKESVKAYLGRSFKTAFETTLVPAFQVGTAVLHSTLEGSMQESSQAINEMVTRDSIRDAKIDQLQGEILALKDLVNSMATELSSIRTDQVSFGAPSGGQKERIEYETDPLALLGQGRVREAVECALEKKSVSILLEVLKGTDADCVLSCCNNLNVVCVIQQLALDFSLQDPDEGIAVRLDWLKELVMAVVSGDVSRKMSLDGDMSQSPAMSTIEESCTTILHGVYDCLKKVETRIAPTGSVRTDLRMLCSLVKSVEF